MVINHKGQRFFTLLCSDLERDGMYLELSEAGSDSVLLEVFYSDVDGSFSIAGVGESIPLEVVEQFIAEARQRLPAQREGI